MSKQDDLRTLTALTEIYDLTQNEYVKLSCSEILRKNNVKYIQYVWKVIQENQLVSVKRYGMSNTIKWNSIKPNIKMANKVNEVAIDMYMEWRNAQNGLKEIKIDSKSGMNEKQLPIYNALKEMHALYSDKYYRLSVAHVLARHKAKNVTTVAVALRECNHVERKGSKFKYVGGAPTLEMVDNIIEKVKEKVEHRNNKYYNKKQEQESPKVQPTTFNVEKCKAEPKQYKKEFKIFGFTIYSTTTTQL